MSPLGALQREFMRELFAERASSPGMEVYRESVRANHRAALAATYPVVLRLVGDAFFTEAARHFGREFASRSGDLADHGEEFAAFLEAYPHARALAYLADVARLEWACHACERAEAAPAFDFAALARVAPGDQAALRFTLDPSLRLVHSRHAIAAIHAANQPGRDGTPDRDAGPDFVLVRRAQGRARVTTIAPDEWRLLERLACGATLRSVAHGAEDAAAALARYVADGIVCGFTAPRGGA